MTCLIRRIRRHGLAGLLAWALLLSVFLACAADNDNPPVKDPYANQRARMVSEDIAGGSLWGRTPVRDEVVLEAMRRVPRHEFVPARLIGNAYDDRPLPIGYGQTISQPYIVAYMTEMLRLEKGDVVLEIGAGSGYQAAVLAEIAKEVYTIEIIDELAKEARGRLTRLGYNSVSVRTGDGYYGWPEHAPFDAIIVTAAASHIPPPLLEQLKPGGCLAIPLGPPMQVQSLMLVEKDKEGAIRQRNVMAVQFVPLTRGKGQGQSQTPPPTTSDEPPKQP